MDFSPFRVWFASEPGTVRIVSLFSMVLGQSRLIWARFALRQTMQTVLACHKAVFEPIGGVPREILYDRMKTVVTGEEEERRVIYNRGLADFARHYGFLPNALRPYRPEAKGKVGRPFRYIREDFFLGSSFHDPDDLTPSSLAGSRSSPIRACTQRRGASSTRPSPRRSRRCSRYR
jgi:transposase